MNKEEILKQFSKKFIDNIKDCPPEFYPNNEEFWNLLTDTEEVKGANDESKNQKQNL